MTGRSSCPECGTVLRIRDRSFVGRRVNCPECKTALRIETANENGEYLTRRLTHAELVHSTVAAGANTGKLDKVSLPRRVHPFVSKWINSPLTAAWLLAIAVMALIAVLTLAPKVRRAPVRPNPPPVAVPPSTESGATPELAKDEKGPSTIKPDESPSVQPAVDSAITISALEPANLSEPLAWPAVSIATKPDPVLPEPRQPPKVSIETKMAYRFPSYKQSKPVSRRDLLESLREQLGAPILYDHDDLGNEELNSTVTFDLENTTVGGVIKTVADGANWELTIEDAGLRLTKKRPR